MAPPAPHRAAPPRLVLRFAVYAGVALALSGAASIWAGKVFATQRAQEDVHEAARYVAERLAADDLARVALAGPATGDVRAQLDDLFAREALGPEAGRVSVIDREGRITYSTDHALIGTKVADPANLAAALAGHRVYGVSETPEGKVVESYVPARWLLADPTWAAGVLAVERDYAPVAARIAADVKRQAAGIGGALLLLYVSLFPILRRVTRTLAQRNRELAASEAQYRALTEQASDAIFVTDAMGIVLEANAQACELLRRRHEELVGLSFAHLVPAEELEARPLRLDELAAGRTILHERLLLLPDGSTVLGELHARMLDDGRILASIRDVTERRRAEEALRRAERAEAAERLAAGIAHDFDSLLVGVVGSSDVLLAHISEGDPLRRHALAVADAAERGAGLVDQLKAFGKRDVQRPRVVEPAEVLGSLEHELRRVAGAGVHVRLELEEGLGRVETDPSRLRELVLALALGAREGMPGGGDLTVRAANVDFRRRTRPAAGDEVVEPGRYVMISVSETGGGRPVSGDRFGFGIAALVGLVERSGGTLGVETDPAAGTTVRIYLPRVDVPAESLPEDAPAEPEAAGLAGSETILLVEDEEIVHAIVEEILHEQGYTVLGARDGREGLELCERHSGPIDLLLTDVVMPELGGLRLADEARRLRPDMAVVLMSGYGDSSPEVDGAAFPFLQKPFTHESLLSTVREALDARPVAV
ncbi:MAG TPA: response regulator [Gaiellaceae bacterium]|nr:response regulator [Gaiellaceae bacterium]